MGLNETPSANRLHIGFFGRRNAGKSSVVNAVTGQDLAVVSDVKGTTTDPVYKSMELLPLGPVMIIDTPGIDDSGALGELRVKKTRAILNKTDVAVLVVDANEGKSEADEDLIGLFKARQLPFVVVYNKSDLRKIECGENEIAVSALKKENIKKLKEMIGRATKTDDLTKKLIADLLCPNEVAVLVTPIDSAAPKGRMILPQQQVIRDVLEADAMSIVVKETQLESALKVLKEPPAIVVTDSQAFEKVSAIVPREVPLTSFSILMARFKGTLGYAVEGARQLDRLHDGDKILISEGCTHHRQCDDIGTVKLPRWIKNYCKKQVEFEFTSGGEFPEDLSQYALIVHCGGCMLNEREMRYRAAHAKENGVAMTNYGIIIAYINGILERSIEMLDI